MPAPALGGGGRGQSPVIFRHADAVGRAAEQLCRLGDAEANVEPLAALGQKRFAPEAFDHPLASLGEVADLRQHCTIMCQDKAP